MRDKKMWDMEDEEFEGATRMRVLKTIRNFEGEYKAKQWNLGLENRVK